MKETASDPNEPLNQTSADLQVGNKLKELRIGRGFSIKGLADRSRLNVNTLSLIEHGKSSPSVSTLQQLALALSVPIAAFFESESQQKSIVFTPVGQRPRQTFGETEMQNLGRNLSGNTVQPFVVTLQPGKGNGDQMIVHTGYEFVYCLSGILRYEIQHQVFLLHPGDSLIFEAHLPHCWENTGENSCQILFILYPADQREIPGHQHLDLD